jgi:hypothetical protein
MDTHAAIELAIAAAALAAATRTIYLNLAERFPALLAYLAALAAINVDLGLLSITSKLYFWSYLVLESLKCLLGIVAVRELFALTFNDYPGIRSVGRWVMYAGIVLALTISLLLTGFFWSGGASGRAHSHLFYFEVAQRSIVFTLVFVIVTILLFLSKYPLHLSRNTLVSSVFFSFLFLSEAAQMLVDSLAPQLHIHYVDWTESIFVAMCLCCWTAMLAPETERAPVRIAFSDPRGDHLLQQLNALNQIMTRAARR